MSYEPLKIYQVKFNKFLSSVHVSSYFCRPLQLCLMVLWIPPRLTQQRTDTTIFTPVSKRMLKYMTRIMQTLSWHVHILFRVRACMIFDLLSCIWAMIDSHLNLLLNKYTD